jgi:hypothetical protein
VFCCSNLHDQEDDIASLGSGDDSDHETVFVADTNFHCEGMDNCSEEREIFTEMSGLQKYCAVFH